MGLVIAVATIAGYGAIWWVFAMWAGGHGSVMAYSVAPVVFLLLVGAGWYRKPDDLPERRRERARRGKIIGDVNSVLVVLISGTLYVLHLLGHVDLLAPLCAIFLGLHFLAFARLFPARVYYVTSVLLLALGAAGLFLPGAAARVFEVGVAASAIHWLTCVAVLIWPESRRTG